MNPNLHYANGDYAIHIAVQTGIIQLVGWLVEKGADIWVSNAQNESPMDVARRCGYTRILRYLEKNSVLRTQALYRDYYARNPNLLDYSCGGSLTI